MFESFRRLREKIRAREVTIKRKAFTVLKVSRNDQPSDG